jgi:hypothetical protein
MTATTVKIRIMSQWRGFKCIDPVVHEIRACMDYFCIDCALTVRKRRGRTQLYRIEASIWPGPYLSSLQDSV